MSLILAAAGKGSRLGELTTSLPKSLLPEPVYGKPILHHMYERLEKESEIKQIVIVGATDSNAAEQIAEFTRTFPFAKKPEIEIVKGERRGVGYAFYLGTERLHDLGLDNAVMSVADSIAFTYHSLIHNSAPVVVGVTKPDPTSEKDFTSIQVDAEGIILPDKVIGEGDSSRIARGVYNLQDGLTQEYSRIFSHGMNNRMGDSQVVNSKGEFKVTWIWRQMQEQGVKVAAGELGSMAELNMPKDFESFRKFFNS